MNPSLRLTFLFAILSTLAFGQTPSKPTIAFQKFHAVRDLPEQQRRSMYDATLAELVNSGRLTIINRDQEMWHTIENELAVQDFITPGSAIDLGKMSGAKYLLSGNISQFTNVYITPANTSTSPYYTCTIIASLKIVNLETGQYEQSVETNITNDNANPDLAAQGAIRFAAAELSQKVQAYFPISVNVEKQTAENAVTINKGAEAGVKEQDIFTVYGDDNLTDIGSLKITWVSPQEATGRVLRGNIKDMIGKAARESRDNKNVNTARIEEKDGNHVIINAGKDIALKKGDVFKSEKIEKVNAGSLVIDKHETLGKIYITKVEQNYAEGKIYRGVNKLSAGMTISAEAPDDQNTRMNFFRIGYKSSFGKTIKANTGSGNVTVSNDSNSYVINTDYLKDVKNIKNIQIYTIAFGTKNLVKDITTVIQADIYKMGILNNWIAHLDVIYDFTLIPEVLFWSVGPSIGYGRLKQNIPNNVVNQISSGYDENLKASSVYAALNMNLNVRTGRFVITAGVSADYLKYSKWKYTYENNDNDNHAIAPKEIIPYANVNLSGLYYSGGLSYYINK